MKHLGFLIFAIFIFSCAKLSSPNDVNTNSILSIFDDIEVAFIQQDLDGIMKFYAADFQHNGNNYDDEKTIWEIRLIDYTSLDFSEISIDFLSDYSAVVSFKMTLKYYEQETVTEEPSAENGDISYFQLLNGRWQIFGNQQQR